MGSSAQNLPADCINLGQGYMNFGPPTWVTNAAEEALNNVTANHYSHPKGRIRLRQALSNFYEPLFNRPLDVENEILVSSGANEGITFICHIINEFPFNNIHRGQDSTPYSQPFWGLEMRSSCLNHISTSIFLP
jgi:histidinol-phosphate/aromatic aminotransferase/cobyric acid decarboxylase-like protein